MEQLKKSPELQGSVLVFAGGMLWGLVGLFFRLMDSAGSTVLLTGFLRTGFAFVIMFAVTVAEFGIKAMVLDARTLFCCFLIGTLCHGAYNVLYNTAVSIVGVTIGAVLLYTAPVFTAVISHFLFKERITGFKCAALVMNVLGCIMAVTGGNIAVENISVLGLLCGIGAGLCYSLNAIIGKLAGTDKNMFAVTTYSYFFAALIFLLILKPLTHPVTISAPILTYGFLFALIPTALAYLIYYLGIQRIRESSKVPVIASIEVVISACIGIAVFGETIDSTHIVGILFVLCSILMMNRSGDVSLHLLTRNR